MTVVTLINNQPFLGPDFDEMWMVDIEDAQQQVLATERISKVDLVCGGRVRFAELAGEVCWIVVRSPDGMSHREQARPKVIVGRDDTLSIGFTAEKLAEMRLAYG